MKHLISKEICKSVIDEALKTGGDFAEVFVENTMKNLIEMVSGNVSANSGLLIQSSIGSSIFLSDYGNVLIESDSGDCVELNGNGFYYNDHDIALVDVHVDRIWDVLGTQVRYDYDPTSGALNIVPTYKPAGQ